MKELDTYNNHDIHTYIYSTYNYTFKYLYIYLYIHIRIHRINISFLCYVLSFSIYALRDYRYESIPCSPSSYSLSIYIYIYIYTYTYIMIVATYSVFPYKLSETTDMNQFLVVHHNTPPLKSVMYSTRQLIHRYHLKGVRRKNSIFKDKNK
jgi:hypothetical protein